MAQNLVINGVTFNSVNSLSIPKSAGGNATFPDTSDATAVAADILSGKTAYAKGVKVTGNIPSKTAQTFTPSTSNQTISSGQYLSGAQTVLGDADLVAGNIKKDVQIFGVTGSYQGSGGNLQSKSVTYTSNGTAKVTPDAGYDALSEVNVTVGVSGGGGASVETCTVTVKFTGNAAGFGEYVGYKVYYTKVVGTATEASHEQYATDELVLNDALKGSVANVVIYDNLAMYGFNLTTTDNVSCVDNVSVGTTRTLLFLLIADSGAIIIS